MYYRMYIFGKKKMLDLFLRTV